MSLFVTEGMNPLQERPQKELLEISIPISPGNTTPLVICEENGRFSYLFI